jgi:hypothetical protein
LKETEMGFKLKTRTMFPALVSVSSPLLLVKTGLAYAFSIDISALLASISPYFVTAQTQQIITTGAASMVATDGLIAFNKTVGSASAVTVSPSLSKQGSCLIADFKGDAATNNITITLVGTDVFPGGGTTWVIRGNGGSIRLTPIPGVGYAV